MKHTYKTDYDSEHRCIIRMKTVSLEDEFRFFDIDNHSRLEIPSDVCTNPPHEPRPDTSSASTSKESKSKTTVLPGKRKRNVPDRYSAEKEDARPQWKQGVKRVTSTRTTTASMLVTTAIQVFLIASVITTPQDRDKLHRLYSCMGAINNCSLFLQHDMSLTASPRMLYALIRTGLQLCLSAVVSQYYPFGVMPRFMPFSFGTAFLTKRSHGNLPTRFIVVKLRISRSFAYSNASCIIASRTRGSSQVNATRSVCWSGLERHSRHISDS